MTGPDRLRQAIATLAGPDIAVAVQHTQRPDGSLWPEEFPAIARAVPARRAEFTAGRVAARQAMAALGLPLAAVPMGADRAPQWPAGTLGSIAHAGGVCVAVLARRGAVRGIGIDLEPAVPLATDLWDTVLRPDERAALALFDPAHQGLQAARIFAAKEAAYKCQYPQSQTILDFDAMLIRLTNARFTASFTRDIPPFRQDDHFDGQFGLCEGFIIALVVQRGAQSL